MPLYQEWSPNEHSLAAIWHVEEDESFFQEPTRLTSDIKHPRRRIEHLAGRYLLQHLKEDFPLHHIAPDVHDKPRLPENQYFFSISHSHPYVAAVISDHEECGIDVQIWKPRIDEIAYMFLSKREQAQCADSRMLTLAWSIKEAAYKWYGRRGAEFIRDLPIHKLITERDANYPPGMPEPFHVEMNCFGELLSPKAMLYKDFALALLVRGLE